MPNTKIRLLNRPVKIGTCESGNPTWLSRVGRNAKTWATPIDSTIDVIA